MNAAPARCVSLLSLALGSCACPTVWLTVTRASDGPPMPAATPSELTSRPIGAPAVLDNRFDVIAPGTVIPDDARHYQELAHPNADPVDALTRAIAGRVAILDAMNASLDDDVLGRAPSFSATARCEPDDHGSVQCGTLEITGVSVGQVMGVEPRVALITYRHKNGAVTRWLRAVDTCEGLDDKRLDEERAGDTEPCGKPRAEGTYLHVTKDFALHDGATVEVSLAPEMSPAQSLISFVHLSDAQIRDHVVKLGDPRLSESLDRLIPSFQQDDDQARHSAEIAEAIVARINNEVAARRAAAEGLGAVPRFVLHTGDAVDAGTFRELDAFLDIMDRLTIPWFNAVGNHDTLVFGNMRPIEADDDGDAACVTLRSVAAPYPVPLKDNHRVMPGKLCVDRVITGEAGERDVFIAGPDHVTSRQTFIDAHRLRPSQVIHIDPRRRHPYERNGCNTLIHDLDSDAHGFDKGPSGKAHGYYAFATPVDDGTGTPRNLVMVVLNTEDLEPHEGGNAGRIGAAQVTWLDKVLDCTRPVDLVMLAGHHQLSEIKVPAAKALRTHDVLHDRRNIVAYLYGHKHKHGICRDAGACGRPYDPDADDGIPARVYTRFWELETASLLEHPQEGRMIRIARLGGDVAFLETVVFGEALIERTSPLAHAVELARRGAERDHCQHPWEYTCSADGHVRRVDGPHAHARLFFRLPGGGRRRAF
jgi:3',5'-cyclic AMP phosphodiesterase CpdA